MTTLPLDGSDWSELIKTEHQRAELLRLRMGYDGCGCALCQDFYQTADLSVFGSRVKRIGDVILVGAGRTGADLLPPDDYWKGEVFYHLGKGYTIADLHLSKKDTGLYELRTVCLGVDKVVRQRIRTAQDEVLRACGVVTLIETTKTTDGDFVTLNCRVCGKDLGSMRVGTRYCSTRCRIKAHRQRKEAQNVDSELKKRFEE